MAFCRVEMKRHLCPMLTLLVKPKALPQPWGHFCLLQTSLRLLILHSPALIPERREGGACLVLFFLWLQAVALIAFL